MENLLKLIFLLNSISGPLAMFLIALRTRRKSEISSISDYVRLGEDPLVFLEVILMTANIIQGLFCLYLFLYYKFPVTILFATVAGFIGTIVSFTRIDKYFKPHIILTVIALCCYSLSIFLSSIILRNSVLFVTSLIQILVLPLGYSLKFKTKYLEVIYFTLLGVWNILVFLIFIK